MLMDGGGIPAFGRRTKSKMDIGEDVVRLPLEPLDPPAGRGRAFARSRRPHRRPGAILDNFHVADCGPAQRRESLLERAAGPGRPGRREDFASAARPSIHLRWATLQALTPGPDYAPAAAPRNNDSLTLRPALRRRSVLLTGDIERQVEAELLSGDLLDPTDVLKVAHMAARRRARLPCSTRVHPRSP